MGLYTLQGLKQTYLVHVVLSKAGRVERILRDRDHDSGPGVAVAAVRVGQQLHDSLKRRNGTY